MTTILLIIGILLVLLMLCVCARVGPKIRELADYNSKLLGTLIMLEWSNGFHCPLCGAYRLNKHFPDCRFLQIFAAQKGYYGKKKIN